jgi:hypothetical protein
MFLKSWEFLYKQLNIFRTTSASSGVTLEPELQLE